jgi:hypothetical protein
MKRKNDQILNEDIIEEIDNLRQEAINRYLDKTDFDVYEFLTKEEGIKLAKAEFEIGDIDEDTYNNIIKSLKKIKG